jgi:hypothetical protein
MAYPTKEFQMAAPTTPEDSGRTILSIFKVMGFGSGATLQTDQVQMQFAINVGEGQGEGESFTSGLQYGVDRGWFELPSTREIKLTDAGFEEM